MKRDALAFFLLAIIVAMGFYLRYQAATLTVVDHPFRSDALDYARYAYNMKYNHIYSRSDFSTTSVSPDAVRTPGYPFFLRYFINPTEPLYGMGNALIAQAVLGCLTILFAYFLAKEMLGGMLMPIAAATLVAFSPHLVSMTAYLLSETLFGFFLMASTLIMACPASRKLPYGAFCAGLLLAMACLTRPWLNYFIIFAVV